MIDLQAADKGFWPPLGKSRDFGDLDTHPCIVAGLCVDMHIDMCMDVHVGL